VSNRRKHLVCRQWSSETNPNVVEKRTANGEFGPSGIAAAAEEGGDHHAGEAALRIVYAPPICELPH
jgi:hypothetical protein